MQFTKQDLFTIVVLCAVFFAVTSWNLGMTQVPTTTWRPTQNENVWIDLGKVESVDTLYLLVKNGSANVTVYTGSPEHWSEHGIFALEGYYSWNNISIDRDTRYLEINFQKESIEIAEIAALGKSGQRLTINAITGDHPDQNLRKFIDEQELVQVPPTYVSETFFDEVFYVSSAESYLKLQQPWEWTHPPLGKLIIASGILIFGYNPFGWRIMGVIFATLMIPLIYVLGKKLFKTWIGAFTSAFLLTFDFMHFTMARMATVDTFVVFFSLASQFFFLIYIQNVLKKGWKVSTLPLFLSVFFFALGFSTKWISLFGFVGQLVILLVLRLKPKLKGGWLCVKINGFFGYPSFRLFMFLEFAMFIYFLTYIPNMLAGYTLTNVFQLQGYMFAYHSELTLSHPFGSKWWSWPLILRPLWLFVSYLPGHVVSTIVLMGNPAVWWGGFIFVILAIQVAVRRKNFACIFITVLFLFQWVSYVFISRTTFIYHFYSCVPFVCLASSYFLDRYWNRKLGKAAALAYFVVVIVLFQIFYPAISGTPAPVSQIDSLKWLESWVF